MAGVIWVFQDALLGPAANDLILPPWKFPTYLFREQDNSIKR